MNLTDQSLANMGAQMEQFETPKDHPNFNSLHYKTPLLKF